MAYDSATRLPRRVPPGIRSVDHIQTGLRDGPKHAASPRGFWLHGPGGPGGNRLDIVRAYAVLWLCIIAAGAVLGLLAAQGLG